MIEEVVDPVLSLPLFPVSLSEPVIRIVVFCFGGDIGVGTEAKDRS